MHTNKKIPLNITDKVEEALSFYPELKDKPITFQFKKNIKKSTMLAQPNFLSLLTGKKNRKYIIYISEQFKIADKKIKTTTIPAPVFIGWIGHELGHIIDYETMSNWELIVFGIKYILFENHLIEAERRADFYAVQRGMQQYILATKNYILKHADISESYKNRIKKYYVSPEEIMHLITEETT